MGEFTQNLLKLTEFPFSYSLLGLLALIFGHGIYPEELSFAKIGPLLILMGFVATTLSICDPVGAVQRRIIKGGDLSKQTIHQAKDLYHSTIFGKSIMKQFPESYLFPIAYPPKLKRLEQAHSIFWGKMQRSVQFETVIKDRELLAQQVEEELDKIPDVFRLITHILQAFKEQTVNTKWIKAEVDRITALIYFIVVISVFIVATLLYPVFLQKFAQVFQDNELTKLVILIASSAALAAVIYMSHRRMSEL